MFIKRTSPKQKTVKISKTLAKCSKCGTPMLGRKLTKTGSIIENELLCVKCQSHQKGEME